MSLDKAWGDAVAYLEALGEARSGDIMLSFDRTDDNRRKVMKKNKSPLISFMAHVTVRRLDNDPPPEHTLFQYQHFRVFGEDAAEAIDQAIAELKAWLATAAGSSKKTAPTRRPKAPDHDLAFLD